MISRRFAWQVGKVMTCGLLLLLGQTAITGSAFAHAAGQSVPFHQQATSASCPQPPAGVDPSTLSDTQLAAYGFPKRPQGNDQAAWRVLLQRAKHRICTSTPTNLTATSQESSPNWAGNIAIGGGYQEVQSYYYVPCVNTSQTSHPAYSSHWVGLGGDNNNGGGNLVQDGTESSVDSNGNPVYYAWYEDYPHDPYENFVFDVNCGDEMYAQADSNYMISGQAYFYIEDIYTGNYYPLSTTGETSLSNGSTAEWISERPTVSGNYPTLADFQSLTFLSAETVHNGSYQYVGQTNHNYAVMCNGGLWTCGPGSTQLAHPGPISSNGYNFTNYWDNGS